MKRLKIMYSDEKGQAMPLIALLTVVLFGFAALVFDVGLMANSRSNLQKTADAAALAAAMDLPDDVKVNTTAIYFVQRNAGDGITTVVVPYDELRRVRVTVSEPVEHYFAKILNFDSTTISATAVAEKNVLWDGFAMPFINLDQKYWETKYWGPTAEDITLWNKQKDSPGSFELVHASELETDKGYLQVDWSDGVEVREGKVSNYINYIENMLMNPGPYYAIGLDEERITTKLIEVKTKQGNIVTVDLKEQNQKLNQEDTILKHQLVLLEFSSITYSKVQGENILMYGKLSNVYDIGDDVLPINKTEFGQVKTKLIE